MYDEDYVARCEAEAEKLHAKIAALGADVPGPIGYFPHDPERTALSVFEFALSEFRRELIDRRGDDLRAGLYEILTAELLAKLNAAKASDNRLIDAGVRLGFLRLLHDLLAQPEVGTPQPQQRAAPKRKPVEDEEDDEEECEEDIGCPIHLEDILGEETVYRIRLDMPQHDLELVYQALGCWVRALRSSEGDVAMKIAEAEVLQRRLGDELRPLLEEQIEYYAAKAEARGALILLDYFGDLNSIGCLIFHRDGYRSVAGED